MTELEVRASKAGMTPLEWLCDQLANGETMYKLAEQFTKRTGIEITRNVLNSAALALDENAQAEITKALKQGAHSIVERQHERLEDLDNGVTKEEIALENLRSKNIQWRAERMNRDEFGQAPTTQINMSLGAVHLDVLRRLSAEDARALQAPPERLVGGDPSGSNIVQADYEIESDPESLI
jgi:hypothetical protein